MNGQVIKFLLPGYITSFFLRGHQRTRKAKRQIALSFIYKGFDVIIGLALVPLILTYLDKERYGIWLVLFSLTSYFTFLNIGLEQGFRNKFAEAVANKEFIKARYYVSTTYAVITIIMVIFIGSFLFANQFVYWPAILNTSPQLAGELNILAILVFISFSITFVLKISTTLLVAIQKPSILDLKSLVDRSIKFLSILVLLYTTRGSLLKMGLVYTITPVISLIIITIMVFSGKQKKFRPSFRYIDFSHVKDLMKLGYKFFIINIAVVILFATDNIIITQLFGPDQVTPYQIARQYFAIPLIVFMLVVKPFWSAVTEAFTKHDLQWIKTTIASLRHLWKYFILGLIFMLIISPVFYNIWLGDKVVIGFGLSVSWALFIGLQTYNAIYTQFINGIGKLKLQLYIAVFSIFANIPLSILFAKYLGLGVAGVILATSISILISIALKSVQYKKLISSKAVGIWNE